MHVINAFRAPRRLLGALGRSTAGMAVTEFAFAAPILAAIGCTGLELANYGLTVLRVNQVAGNIGDVLSRSGELDGLGMKHVRESDINDAFTAVDKQYKTLSLATRGRVIVSSEEMNSKSSQWIHWQRCYGSKTTYVSAYGVQGKGKSDTTLPGMGPATAQAKAPDTASAVMYVEVQYDYSPILPIANARYLTTSVSTIKAHAAFLVRDRRDLSDTNNPVNDVTAAQKKTC